MKVKELMNRPLIVDKPISLAEAAKIMSSKRIGSLLFVKNGKVKGIITERDLLKNFNKNKSITEVMEKSVITVESDEDLEYTIELMRDNNIKRLPVVDDNKLVGIITLTDIAAHVEEVEGDFFFD